MTSRGDSDFLLDCDVGKVRAVSPSRAKNLAKMGIMTVRDLLENYPRRYIDLSNIETAARAPIGQFVTVVGTVDEITEKQPRRRLHILEVAIFDGTGVIIATWFRQPWMTAKFERGMRVAFSGKVSFEYGFKRMSSPYVAFLGEPGQPHARLAQMIAVHPATEGISTTWMRRFVANALEQAADMTDTLPVDLRFRHGLIGKKAALRIPSTDCWNGSVGGPMTIYKTIGGINYETQVPIINDGGPSLFDRKIRSFLDAVETDGKAPVSSSEILINQAIIDGIVRSANAGHEVTVEIPEI